MKIVKSTYQYFIMTADYKIEKVFYKQMNAVDYLNRRLRGLPDVSD